MQTVNYSHQYKNNNAEESSVTRMEIDLEHFCSIESLTELPVNVLIPIMCNVGPRDLLALTSTCKKLLGLSLNNNMAIWKVVVEKKWKDLGVLAWLDNICQTNFAEAPLIRERLMLPPTVDFRWMARCLSKRVLAADTQKTLGFELKDDLFSVGCWVEGFLEGPGLRIYKDKHIYFGEWLAGRWHGQGVVLSSTPETGGLYIGNYNQSMSDGFGFKKWLNGASYVGEWKKNRINGQGLYTWANGSVYEGSWRNNERDGFGRYSWANSSEYVGMWKSNNFHGEGTKVYENGDVYDGMWNNDVQHGHGTYITWFGSKFEGEYQHGQKVKGRFTHTDGYSWEGKWNKGIPTDDRANHPEVYLALYEGRCTQMVSKSRMFGQVLFQCMTCLSNSSTEFYCCQTCAVQCSHPQNHRMEAVWTFGSTQCCCQRCDSRGHALVAAAHSRQQHTEM